MSDSNLFQTTTNAPEKMPVSVIQDIKNLICPAPMKPITANTRLVQINKEIQQQADAIALLEKHVVQLEQRYQIQFSVGQVNMYNENAINQIFNITYGNSRKINDLLDLLKKEFPNVKLLPPAIIFAFKVLIEAFKSSI